MAVLPKPIEAGGKNRPFFFSYKALKRFCKDTGKSLSNALAGFDNLDFGHIESLLFRGFEAGAEKEELKITFTREDIENWIDQDFQLIEKCTEAISEFFGTDNEAKETTTEKKTLAGANAQPG